MKEETALTLSSLRHTWILDLDARKTTVRIISKR